MADTTTANYGWVKPEPNASADTWGGKLNADLDAIDADLKAASNVANAALPKADNLASLSSAATARSNLGVTTGTSGAVLGFLSANNTHGGNNTFSGANTFSGPNTFSAGTVFAQRPENVQAYTFGLTDANRTIYYALVSLNGFYTIPTHAAVPFALGARIRIIRAPGPTGALSVAPDAGVTLHWQGTTGARTFALGAAAWIEKVASDVWLLTSSYGVS